MALLFIDSTYDLTLGLLDDKFNWLGFSSYSDKKASAIIQQEVFELLKKHQLKVSELSGLISISGPGFYTGLRLSEGFADIFKFFNIPIYSLYSYEIPLLCGFDKGTWLTKAYRGEYFFHQWSGDKSENVLLTTKELPDYLSKIDEVFIHSDGALDDLSRQYIKRSVSTLELLKKEASSVLSEIIKEKRFRDSFYFRAPEDEFRVST